MDIINMAEVDPEQRDESKPDEQRQSLPVDLAALWLEPQVQTYAIFTELLETGDRTQVELALMLARYHTNMGWADFWGQEGYLAERVMNSGPPRFGLTGKALLLLELP